ARQDGRGRPSLHDLVVGADRGLGLGGRGHRDFLVFCIAVGCEFLLARESSRKKLTTKDAKGSTKEHNGNACKTSCPLWFGFVFDVWTGEDARRSIELVVRASRRR